MSEFFKMRYDQYLDGLLDMIISIGDTSNMSMIEIGSYTGESTIIFAEHFKKVISIDPFLNYYDNNDAASNLGNLDDVYMKFIERTNKFENIFHIKEKSENAIDYLKEKVDFVYIDGIHTYEQVKKDINNYIGIIKDNGIIGGHDYSSHFSGVVNAVNEILGIPDATFQDTSWIKRI